jgi:hypothetical protein
LNGSPEGCILIKREMRAEPVIVGGISRQDPAKMRFTEHDDMIEALTSD